MLVSLYRVRFIVADVRDHAPRLKNNCSFCNGRLAIFLKGDAQDPVENPQVSLMNWSIVARIGVHVKHCICSDLAQKSVALTGVSRHLAWVRWLRWIITAIRKYPAERLIFFICSPQGNLRTPHEDLPIPLI